MTRAAVLLPSVFVVLFAGSAFAQPIADADPVPDSVRFVLDTWLLVAGGLAGVAASVGFALRESGLARARNAGAPLLRGLAGYAVCALMYWLVGYNLAYGVEPGGLLGALQPWNPDDQDPLSRGHAASAGWFSALAFPAVALAIVAGVLGERLRFWPFLGFAAIFAGVIYPIAMSWSWGGGLLSTSISFADFGGSVVVHATAGWAALAGAMIVGPRVGRYDDPAERAPISNIAAASAGAAIVWLTFYALYAVSLGSIAGVAEAADFARIVLNATLGAAAGVLVAAAITQTVYRRIEVPAVLNGALGALVALAAEPLAPALWQAVVIGAFAGVLVTVAPHFLDRLRIDDASGGVATHLLCGAWGAIILPWSREGASFLGQIIGLLTTGAFVFVTSALAWLILRYTTGARVSPAQEELGLDAAQLGEAPYPGGEAEGQIVNLR